MASTDPRRGEVWLASFGAGRKGEPAKNRPAVVVSADELNADARGSELIVVVPLSSSRAQSALRPEVPPGAGIDRDSRAICRAVRSVARSCLLHRLGTLSPEPLAEIESALSLILGLGRAA
jgi:mRNA interferase MazF